MPVSERVALCLPLPGVIVTGFMTCSSWSLANRKAVRERILVIGGPEEISARKLIAVVGVLVACMFAGRQEVHEDIPCLRLSGVTASR